MLGLAHIHGIAMLTSPQDPWVYAHNVNCTDFECYFDRWSNCTKANDGAFAEGVFDVDRAAHHDVFGMVPQRCY